MIVKDYDLGKQPDGDLLVAAPTSFWWLDGNSQAFAVSFAFHLLLVLGLAITPLVSQSRPEEIAFDAIAPKVEEEFTVTEEIAPTEELPTEIGANSDSNADTALSMAPVLAEIAEVPAPSIEIPMLDATYDLNNQIKEPVGLTRSESVVRGMTGVGTTGTAGAVDRITAEILRAIEQRPTLVVWLFDQSGSLQRRRQEIRDRFDRIYEELGIIQKEQSQHAESPAAADHLLTAVISFGAKVNLLTKKPTADIDEIRAAIDAVQLDQSGIERVFSAIYLALDKFKSYRSASSGHGPERNVLFIAVTDERGDDIEGMEKTIDLCRKSAIPVYVIGVPAPFGREFTYVKYVDPDPKFDQSPQWAQVDQGPESLFPERVKIGFKDNYYDEPVLDSGFGPYALSRLCYETGGIYFMVHPNRQFARRISRNEIAPFSSDLAYFFDPEVMTRYRPDYVSVDDYSKKVKGSPLRQALVAAARLTAAETLSQPTTRFVKRDEASLTNSLTTAQQQAARLVPQLDSLATVLQNGAAHRNSETSPRWLAGFDLAIGVVMAHKVRADGYNAMLAKAKRGMAFASPKNNTWILAPDDEITSGSKLEKEGETARLLLEQVANGHRGTPWGMLATRELKIPLGWKWTEDFTDLTPSRPGPRGNNAANIPRAAQDEKAKMLAPQAPKRPIPKL